VSDIPLRVRAQNERCLRVLFNNATTLDTEFARM